MDNTPNEPMVKVGRLRRGLRGQYSHTMQYYSAATDLLYRDDEQDGPEYIDVFTVGPVGETET